MNKANKNLTFLYVQLVLLLSLASVSWAITFTPFGPAGEGGTVNSQTLTIGSGGEVFEMDAFLSFGGTDTQLSVDPLPVGLDYTFSASLSQDATDLLLTYTFLNDTASTLNDVRFFSFLDAEIDAQINLFFNEYGEVVGTAGSGASDADPDLWEIDEPGYLFGDIYDNLLMGTLDNTNAAPIGLPDDLSMALGFELGTLNPLDTATINVLISEDNDFIGSLALAHHDSGPASTTVITLSGQSTVTPVPEPSTLLLLDSGLLALGGFIMRIRKGKLR